MRVYNLALAVIFSSLLALTAEAQTSRPVSAAPWLQQILSKYEVSTPLQTHFEFFRAYAHETDPLQRESLNFYEMADVLDNADRMDLVRVASEHLFMQIYEEGLEKGSDGQVVAAAAYLTGLANPLHKVTVTEHARILSGVFGRRDVESITYTITYSLNRGIIKFCQTRLEKDRQTGEITHLDLEGCPHYVDEF